MDFCGEKEFNSCCIVSLSFLFASQLAHRALRQFVSVPSGTETVRLTVSVPSAHMWHRALRQFIPVGNRPYKLLVQ